MAIWQFDLSFIEQGGPLPRRTDEGHDVPPLDAERITTATTWLNEKYGPPWKMTDGWYVFGDEDGDRVDLLANPDGSFELSARVDMRSNSSAFIADVCELGQALNCELFSAEFWGRIEPIPTDVVRAASTSSAAAFVEQPLQFLRDVAGGA